MKKIKQYKIYALVFGIWVYIGKTFANRVSEVYRRHCRGERKSTRAVAEKEKPELHLLFRDKMQDYEAYRYVLAYINLFRQAGYKILNCPRSIDRAGDLKPETEAIAMQLKTEDINNLLSRTLVKKLSDVDEVSSIPQTDIQQEKADQKLTIRVTQSEKEAYKRIGTELDINQRETLLYLFAKMNQVDPVFLDLEGDGYLRALINAYREENAKLKKANSALQDQIVKSRADKRNKLMRKDAEIMEIKKGIQQYFAMMEPTCKIPVGFEIGRYEDFLPAQQYQFPKEVGPYVFRPQEILRSKGRWGALFLLGKGDNDKLYKFRWYPKRHYAGLQIQNPLFGKRGSVWLVGCEKANDGAMDMIYAFPLDVQFRYDGPDEYGSKLSRDVADLLKEIESYQDS